MIRSTLVKCFPSPFRRMVNSYLAGYKRRRSYNAVLNQDSSSTHHIVRNHLARNQNVDKPLVLISQLPRSGGTLLSQLFDYHPQCLVHPGELKIGYPTKIDWPKISENQSEKEWFFRLCERDPALYFINGFNKSKSDSTSHEFIFLTRVQRDMFYEVLRSDQKFSERKVFDAYFTSYFGAWLDHQRRYGPKKYIVAFQPSLLLKPENLLDFERVYPDGKAISLIRDPVGWYASVSHHPRASRAEWFQENLDGAIEMWKESAKTLVSRQNVDGDRRKTLLFNDLVSQPDEEMSKLCDWLDIDWDEALLTPTFNGNHISANTSFDLNKSGTINKGSLNRRSVLSSEIVKKIEKETETEWNDALKCAANGNL